MYSDLPQYSTEYFNNIYKCVPTIDTEKGTVLSNYKSEFLNIVNGMRVNTNQPQVYKNSIFIAGRSSTYGIGCEDKHTLPSQLQEIINDTKASQGIYCVSNLAVLGCMDDVYIDY